MSSEPLAVSSQSRLRRIRHSLGEGGPPGKSSTSCGRVDNRLIGDKRRNQTDCYSKYDIIINIVNTSGRIGLAADTIVIGFTGSFGSGCTEFADRIAETYGFGKIKLSQRLWDEAGKKASREQLQAAGDKIRENEGNDALAKWAVKKWRESGKPKRFIFDSIKNLGEVAFLRGQFPNFYLVAVGAPTKERWNRVKETYKKWGLDRQDFDVDDERDREETDLPYGQNVRGCTEVSDIILDNSDADSLDHNIDRLADYMKIILDPARFKTPTWSELHMNHAFLVARMSHCLQRQVGAVITDENNFLVACGFNDVPMNIRPCREYPESGRKCYRHHIMTCPECNTVTKPLKNCPKCGTNLEEKAKSRKDLDLCRAAHAEENAIIQTAARGGVSLSDCILYTTTFPCLLCAKKIINVGISKIVYVDPYPVRESWNMLRDADIKLVRYSGTTPRGYVRMYVEA